MEHLEPELIRDAFIFNFQKCDIQRELLKKELSPQNAR